MHDERDSTIASLTAQVAHLKAELNQRQDLERMLREERKRGDASIAAIRRQLEPLYNALQALFGTMEDVAPGLGVNTRNTAVWEAWKTRLGGLPAKAIDALLLHGGMTRTQLRIAVGCRSRSVSDIVYKLNQAGLIDKNGGKISLKEMQ